jgi:hypothetical protein
LFSLLLVCLLIVIESRRTRDGKILMLPVKFLRATA